MRRLRVAYRTFDGFERALTEQAAAFSAGVGGGCGVELVPFDPPGFVSAFVNGDELASGRWDVVMLLTDWIPRVADRGGLLALDDRLMADPPERWPSDFHDGVLRLGGYDGATYALPYHDGPQALMYRTDLFADQGERAAFHARHGRELEVPRTWAHFLDVASFFSRGPHLAGCVVAAYPDGHNTVYDFLIHLWARGGRLLDEGGEPAFDSEAGVAALTWLRDLVAAGTCQADALNHDSVRAGATFAEGGAAMMWNWLGFAVAAELPGSPVRGLIACAPMPGHATGPGPTLSLYWTLAIPVGAPDPDLSWAFLTHTASSHCDRMTARAGAVAVRLSTWRNEAVRADFPAYRVIEQAHASARNLPHVPDYPVVNDLLNEAIDRVYRHAVEPRAALADAAARLRIARAGVHS